MAGDTCAPSDDAGQGGYDSRYYSRLVEIEEGNFWFRNRNALIVWALRRYFPGARSFLEVGCGTAFLLRVIARELPRLAVSGCDLHPEAVALAEKRIGGARLFVADARSLDLDETFDVIGAFDVLEHIEEDEDVLARLRRAVRPGGGILVTVPQHPSLFSYVDARARHLRRYSARDLTLKIERAGFRVVRVTSFLALLLPALVLSRARKPRAGKDPLAVPGLRLGRGLDRLLASVLSLERAMIRMGTSFPAGGSLLAVARAAAPDGATRRDTPHLEEP